MSDNETRRKNELLQKLQERTLSMDEHNELQNIMERERNNASRSGNWTVFFGALLLLAALAAYLGNYDDDNRRRRRRSR